MTQRLRLILFLWESAGSKQFHISNLSVFSDHVIQEMIIFLEKAGIEPGSSCSEQQLLPPCDSLGTYAMSKSGVFFYLQKVPLSFAQVITLLQSNAEFRSDFFDVLQRGLQVGIEKLTFPVTCALCSPANKVLAFYRLRLL